MASVDVNTNHKFLRQRDLPLWLLVATIVVASIAASATAVYFWQFGGSLSSKQEVWGQFGEYVGGLLSPLFALAALLGLLYTIILQNKDIRESSQQVHASQEVLERQVVVLARQNFESTFFQMLKLYNQLVQQLRLEKISPTEYAASGTNREYLGRECFKRLQEVLCRDYIEKVNRGDYVEPKLDALDLEYEKFYKVYGGFVGHYFRTIYNIVKFVDRDAGVVGDPKLYTNLLRAQLSKYELGLLFYNCLSKYGRIKLLPLVKKYDLLKHLENEVLHDPSDRDLYQKPVNEISESAK
jgi:hypothetical protein